MWNTSGGPQCGLGIMTGECDQVLYNNVRVSGPNKRDMERKAKKTTHFIVSRVR